MVFTRGFCISITGLPFLFSLPVSTGVATTSSTGSRKLTPFFLAFSKAQGNDLSTPMPQYGFAGLKPGDRWCLCASRWKEALDAGAAPQVVLEATHAVTLHVVSLEELKKYAFRLQ